MPGVDGATLREWRRSRGWDVPEVARQLRRAADQAGVQIAAHDGLVRMIYAWERGDHDLSERYERYELLYRKAGFPDSTGNDETGSQPGSLPGVGQEDDPVRRRTFVELTGTAAEPAEASDLTTLSRRVSRARNQYQACRYSELVSRLPALLADLHAACVTLADDARLHA
jgi:hypothetical protein